MPQIPSPTRNSPRLSQQALLELLQIPDFVPFPLMSSGSLQTIAGAYLPHRQDFKDSEFFKVPLGNLDYTICAVDRPEAWEPGGPVAFLIHGLAGTHQSSYMVRLARRLHDECYLVVRMNLRNAGVAFGLSRKTYHGGITEDTRAMLAWVYRQFPGSLVSAFGFSLAGNLLLKMAAEEGAAISPYLHSIATVCPAIDLERASVRLAKYPGRFFAKIFLKDLLYDLGRLNKLFPDDMKPLSFPKNLSIRDFDEIHNSLYHGFNGADDYYAKCSSLPHLENIVLPTLILGAKDDPVIDVTGVLSKNLPAHIDTILTDYGGHVGYIGISGGETSLRWSDDLLMNWLHVRGSQPRVVSEAQMARRPNESASAC